MMVDNFDGIILHLESKQSQGSMGVSQLIRQRKGNDLWPQQLVATLIPVIGCSKICSLTRSLQLELIIAGFL